jgi:hypothetical protein
MTRKYQMQQINIGIMHIIKNFIIALSILIFVTKLYA